MCCSCFGMRRALGLGGGLRLAAVHFLAEPCYVALAVAVRITLLGPLFCMAASRSLAGTCDGRGLGRGGCRVNSRRICMQM